MIRRVWQSYADLEKEVRWYVLSEFFIQLVNAGFFLILNIYLAKKSYSDPQIAALQAYRFFAVVAIAIPFGIFIKGRKILPYLRYGALGVPLFSLGMLYCSEINNSFGMHAFFMAWGFCFALFNVGGIPYLLRHTRSENYSHTLGLYYVAQSLSPLLGGALIYGLQYLFPNFFDDLHALILISCIGFIGVLCLTQIPKAEKISKPEKEEKKYSVKNYDWFSIVKSTVPTLMIAVGAGLTIPFLNLFFYRVFHLGSDGYALLGAISAVGVTIATTLVPFVKKRYGYKVAITLSQAISVSALLLLASTQFFSMYAWALYAAIIFFLIRQPLMNMAMPMTQDLTMIYVGERNREMLSAIVAAIWNGSWFFSSLLFRQFILWDWTYAEIFYITGLLYIVGIIFYYLLIIEFENRKSLV
jgi:MFS family permease